MSFIPRNQIPMTLIEMLEKNIRLCPSKSAIICEEKTFSYTELHESVMKLSQYFFLSGIEKGAKIAVMMDTKKPELIIAFLSIAACGCIAVPIDCNQTDAYINQIFDILSPAAIVVSEHMCHRLERCDLNLPESLKIVCKTDQISGSSNPAQIKEIDQGTSLADILSRSKAVSLPPVPIKRHDAIYFNMTSGTTGSPKCAITTHDNIYWNTLSAVEQLSLTKEDIHLCMFPPATHPHELFARALFLGGTMVLTDHIAPKSLTKVIENNRVTAMMAVPPIYGALAKCHKNNDFNFTTLRVAESGGMHCDPITAKEFKERFGIPIIPVWGSTETAGIALAIPLTSSSKTGSCGIPSKYYEVQIVDKNSDKVFPGKVGEMIVKGKGVCASYYQNESETQKNFRNGWFYTNDMFKKDDDGFFYFSGRKNGMMKVAGMKVFPIEIEDMLILHPLIREAAVTKVSDPVYGEIPKAVIVLEDGALLTKKELKDYCASKIASYKIPKIIEFRNSLPRTPVGKIIISKL